MKLKSLAALFAVVIGLGIYLYYGIQKPAEKADAEKDTTDLWIAKDWTKLKGLSLKNQNHDIEFESKDNIWTMTKPEQDLAAQSKIENLITNLKKVKREKVLLNGQEFEERKDNLSSYGLGVLALKIKLKFEGDTGWTELQIGSKNPSGKSTYAKMSEKPEVDLISESFDFLKAATPNDYREMKLTSVQASQIEKLQIKTSGTEKYTFRKKDSKWEIEENPKLPIDQNFLLSQINKLSLIRANQFLKTPPSKLGKPDFSVLAGFATGAKDLRTKVGDPRAEGLEFQFFKIKKSNAKPRDTNPDSYDYYILSDKAGLTEVSRFHYDNFNKKLQDYIRKSFDYFPLAEIERMKVQNTKESSNFEAGEINDAWTVLDSKESSQIKSEKITNLIAKVLGLKASRYLPKSLAIANPDLQIGLTAKDGNTLLFKVKEQKDNFLISLKNANNPELYYELPTRQLNIKEFSIDSLVKASQELKSKSVNPLDEVLPKDEQQNSRN